MIASAVGGLWFSSDPRPAVTPVVASGPDTVLDNEAALGEEDSDRPTTGVVMTEVAEARAAFSVEEAGGTVAMHAIGTDGESFFAFGSVSTSESWDLVGWRSADGRKWDRVFESDEFGTPERSPVLAEGDVDLFDIDRLFGEPVRIDGIVEYAGTVLAFGNRIDRVDRTGRDHGQDGFIIRSGDGGDTWSTVELSQELGAKLQLVDIVATESGFVMVAHGLPGAVWGEPGHDLIVFIDPDASDEEIMSLQHVIEADATIDTFTFVDQVEAFEEFGELFADNEEIIAKVEAEVLPPSYRLTFKPSTELATDIEVWRDLAGVQRVIEAPDRPAVLAWNSQDGIEWSGEFEVATAGSGAFTFVADVAAHGSTVVAVGTEATGPVGAAAVWVSEDAGRSWRRADVTSTADPAADLQIGSVAWTGTGFVATGSASLLDDAAPGTTITYSFDPVTDMAWQSVDGESWRSIEPPMADGVIHSEADGNVLIAQYASALRPQHASIFVHRGNGEGNYASIEPLLDLDGKRSAQLVGAVGSRSDHLVLIEITTNNLQPDAITETAVFRIATGE